MRGAKLKTINPQIFLFFFCFSQSIPSINARISARFWNHPNRFLTLTYIHHKKLALNHHKGKWFLGTKNRLPTKEIFWLNLVFFFYIKKSLQRDGISRPLHITSPPQDHLTSQEPSRIIEESFEINKVHAFHIFYQFIHSIILYIM